MTLDPQVDLLFSVLILLFAIIACLSPLRKPDLRPKAWKPLSLVLLSLLTALVFVNSITFGSLTLEYSRGFAAIGMVLSIVAIVLARRRSTGSAFNSIVVGSWLSLAMWWFLVTLH